MYYAVARNGHIDYSAWPMACSDQSQDFPLRRKLRDDFLILLWVCILVKISFISCIFHVS